MEVESLPADARLASRVPAPQPITKDLQLLLLLFGMSAFEAWAGRHFVLEGRAIFGYVGAALSIALFASGVFMGWGAWREHRARVREVGAPILLAPRLRLRVPTGLVELSVDPIRGQPWEQVMEGLGFRLEGDVLLVDAWVDVVTPDGEREIQCVADGYEPPQAVRRDGVVGFAVLALGTPAEWALAYNIAWTGTEGPAESTG